MKKLYLVDVSSMFFRAFYAIPPLRTSAGLPTNALYGFLAMSVKLLRENRPDYMVYCFDRKDPSFRNEIYEDYKANRSEMPDDLEPQMPYIRELTEKLGILALDKKSFEADDIIGTLALQGAKNNLDVSIVSGDKDFAQLVNDRITLYDTMKNVRYDRAGVVEKWGVEPEQIVDYLAIVGDTSDNIPGVRGVGPKGAQKLLAEYKTLENIYKNIEKIKPDGTRNKLIESKESAFLAKKLVSIVTDIDLKLQIEDMTMKPINKAELTTLLEELEFGAFVRKLFNDNGASSSESGSTTTGGKPKIEKNRSQSENSKKQKQSREKNNITQGLPTIAAYERVQWTLNELKKNIEPYEEIWAVQNERGFCLGYKNKAIQVDGSLEEVGAILGPKMLAWKGFDLKSKWHLTKMPNVVSPKWDTMLAAYVVKAGNISDFSTVYNTYTGRNVPELASPEDILQCELELEPILKAKLDETRGMSVLEKYELPLVPVLYDMEVRGIALDRSVLKKQSDVLAVDIEKLEKEIHSLAGESFNISSPKQLGAILFEKLKIPTIKKTKTGYSTDSDVLSKLSPQYPICGLVSSYRELTKLKSTYVDALPALVGEDGRLHTRFQQALTQTGRLSSINPNLQNIPIRTDRGRAIRQAFVAKEGHYLLSIDYSQIELRVLAEITKDPGLNEAFNKNYDIHAATAAEVFNIKIDEVTPEQRRMAKAVNFGIAYGQGVYGLAETLEISRDEAKTIIENYFNKFSKVKDYMLETVNVAKEQGYVENIFGRRRYMDEFNSSSGMVRKFGERAAINAPIQGAASDLMKLAMIKVYEECSISMLLQVHDELVFECPKDQVEEQALNIKKIMESVVNFKVPLKVNVAWGVNWEDAHA
ncbi:MAG: DNA polymerase I [Bdellovibrionales bacterium]|nr:DNA polymerase I [Bdellovibrionales bacterium]